MQLPNLKFTKILLFGTQSYNDLDFPSIDPAINNVAKLAILLKKPEILGIPARNIKSMINEPIDELINQLSRLKRDPDIETFIFYYVGHGHLFHHRGKYNWFLTAKDSFCDINDYNKVNKKALEYNDFKDYVENIGSFRIVILDACYSGHATQGNNFAIDDNLQSTFTITSSSHAEKSLFNPRDDYTYFTGELIKIIENGINRNIENITLNMLFNQLLANIREQNNIPLPRQKNNFITDFAIVKNLNFFNKGNSQKIDYFDTKSYSQKNKQNDLKKITEIIWFDKVKGYFTDPRDQRKYNVARVGNQIWMTENLAYKVQSGGWLSNKNSFGYLYNWETAMNSIPSGWHIPNNSEWEQVIKYLGGEKKAGKKLKSLIHWHNGNNGNNDSEFNAFPAGICNINGTINSAGLYGNWWSSSLLGKVSAWYFKLSYLDDIVRKDECFYSYGLSVRCIKD